MKPQTKTTAILIASGVIFLIAVFGIVHQFMNVPHPNVNTNQTSSVQKNSIDQQKQTSLKNIDQTLTNAEQTKAKSKNDEQIAICDIAIKELKAMKQQVNQGVGNIDHKDPNQHRAVIFAQAYLVQNAQKNPNQSFDQIKTLALNQLKTGNQSLGVFTEQAAHHGIEHIDQQTKKLVYKIQQNKKN